jgi:hypothetical protein
MAPLPTRITAPQAAPAAKHKPSPQQTAVYEWTSNSTGSAVIEAVAGAAGFAGFPLRLGAGALGI